MKVYVAVCWRETPDGERYIVNVGVFSSEASAQAFGERYDDWEIHEREVEEQ